ncbi:MAG: WYL domain-containing protein [Bacteroidales bacterium]|nr:WYL domain-containing protein [Bacteroidales bacterium]
MNPLKKYIWLVDTLMRAGDTGLTIKQVSDAYEYDDEISNGEKYNGRTFHRHRKEVKDIFDIEIECYPTGSEFRYRIADKGDNDYFRRWLMDSIAVNRVISDSKDTAQYISIENANTEHLPAILQSLKEHRKVEFDYKPYWADTETHYFDFQPHAIKMFERRWYLIGRYKKDMPYIILALDRISQFEIKEETFHRDPNFNLEEMFDGVFGITVGDGDVESIWLKVEARQANYLRSLPLHRSQMELTSRYKGYALFALRVRPSYDLRQRILSLGSTVEVLKPESLRNEIREEAKAMVAKYMEDDE